MADSLIGSIPFHHKKLLFHEALHRSGNQSLGHPLVLRNIPRRIASAVVECQKQHQQFVRREMIFLHLILKIFPVCFLYLKIIFKKVFQHVPPPFRRFMPSLRFS